MKLKNNNAQNNFLVRDNINFLEFPNWVVDERNKAQNILIPKGHGTYEAHSSIELPKRFDKVVLYFLLNKLATEGCPFTGELITTYYSIVRGVFEKKQIGGKEYNRIYETLETWKKVTLKFDGVFFEGNGHTTRHFGVIDDIILKPETDKIYIAFNRQYILQLHQPSYNKLINFQEYKSLRRSVSARLYEILIKSFFSSSVWCIGIEKLAEKLTLTKKKYPAHIIEALQPAVKEISSKTSLCVELQYDKQKRVCTFILKKSEKKKKVTSRAPAPIVIADDYEHDNPDSHLMYEKLTMQGVAPYKAHEIVERFTMEEIDARLSMMDETPSDIRNRGGWLAASFDQNWDISAIKTRKEEQRKQEEIIRKRKEAEAAKKIIEQLKEEFGRYKDSRAVFLYEQLSEEQRHQIDADYRIWLEDQKKSLKNFLPPEDICRVVFLAGKLIDEKECNFITWSKQKGYDVKETKHGYAIVTNYG